MAVKNEHYLKKCIKSTLGKQYSEKYIRVLLQQESAYMAPKPIEDDMAMAEAVQNFADG